MLQWHGPNIAWAFARLEVNNPELMTKLAAHVLPTADTRPRCLAHIATTTVLMTRQESHMHDSLLGFFSGKVEPPHPLIVTRTPPQPPHAIQ